MHSPTSGTLLGDAAPNAALRVHGPHGRAPRAHATLPDHLVVLSRSHGYGQKTRMFRRLINMWTTLDVVANLP